MNKNELKMNALFTRARIQLGGPVNSVELTDEQMSSLIVDAEEAFNLITIINQKIGNKDVFLFMESWVNQYFFALCKETLALGIRGKYEGLLPIPGAELKLNYKDLLEESIREKQFLRYLILKDKNILESQKPILVFYVGIGNLDNSDVEKFINQVKERMFDCGFIKFLIPIREESRIECIYPSGVNSKTSNKIDRIEKQLKKMTKKLSNE